MGGCPFFFLGSNESGYSLPYLSDFGFLCLKIETTGLRARGCSVQENSCTLEKKLVELSFELVCLFLLRDTPSVGGEGSVHSSKVAKRRQMASWASR